MPRLSACTSGLALVLLAACGGDGTGPSSEPPPLLTALPRPLTAAETSLASASNRFAFDLLAHARATDPEGTVFLSPLSASMALGMTLNGANGTTFDAMRTTLGFGSLPQAEINAGYRGLLDLLARLDSSTDIRVGNSIWAETGFPFLPTFVQEGQEWFDAEVRNVAFADPATLEAVNGWVREKTGGKIPKLLDQFDPQTVMTLLNAVYFKGSWRTAFKPSQTRSESFTAPSGAQPVAMMHREGAIQYAEDLRYQAVDLLYGNGGFGMTLVLPRPGVSLADVLGEDPAVGWDAVVDRLTERTVELAMPRFRLEYRRDLSDDLRALGMAVAFDDQQADFSRMAAPPIQLFISSVLQKTFVEVNEEGTEAAAATAVQIGVTSLPQTYQMKVDRPFLVAIRERFSGTLLFLGQVATIPPAQPDPG